MTMQTLVAQQLDAAAAVYTRAFMDDPFSVWVTPDPVRREHDLPLFFRMAMRYAMRYRGRVEASDGRPGAVATWLAPERPLPTNLGMLRTGLLGLLWAGGWSGAGRFFTFGEQLEGLHARDVKQPHWYLWLLAVDPPFQGKGLGDMMSSWISTGPNPPISAAQVTNVLGDDTMGQFARKAGIPMGEAGSMLASLLPTVIDKLTPEGKVPDTDSLENTLSSFLGKIA